MSTIGTFTKQEDGFNGTLHTLAFNVKVKIVPITKDKDQGPGLSRPCWRDGDRRGVEAPVEGEQALSVGQARRPVVRGAGECPPR